MDGLKFLDEKDEFLANYVKENMGNKTLVVQAEELYQMGYRLSAAKPDQLTGTQICSFRIQKLKLFQRNTWNKKKHNKEVGI